MSLRSFMSCGYALLIDAYQQIGSDLVTAVQRADESIFGTPSEPTAPSAEAIDNDRALAELQKMLGGIA